MTASAASWRTGLSPAWPEAAGRHRRQTGWVTIARPEVRESGLWNIAGVGADHGGEDNRLLARLEELTEGTSRVRTRGAGRAQEGNPEVLLSIPCSASRVPTSQRLFEALGFAGSMDSAGDPIDTLKHSASGLGPVGPAAPKPQADQQGLAHPAHEVLPTESASTATSDSICWYTVYNSSIDRKPGRQCLFIVGRANRNLDLQRLPSRSDRLGFFPKAEQP